MASGRRGWDSSHEDDLPVYLARPGTTDQVPRQKYGGMFCNVEGAFESKTLDFDALSVGQRGAKTPRSSQGSSRGVGSRPGLEGDSPRRSQGREESREPTPAPPAPAGVEIRSATGKEVLQNLGPKDKGEDRSSRHTSANVPPSCHQPIRQRLGDQLLPLKTVAAKS
uniref:Dihydropyrimidinase like 3 n=1 Tax=Molossus molossus TaxID=27622 RepID=A0A7J8I597_MOLMO|nr:dihydropyrimidinase like 3 [Molossus molossus]